MHYSRCFNYSFVSSKVKPIYSVWWTCYQHLLPLSTCFLSKQFSSKGVDEIMKVFIEYLYHFKSAMGNIHRKYGFPHNVMCHCRIRRGSTFYTIMYLPISSYITNYLQTIYSWVFLLINVCNHDINPFLFFFLIFSTIAWNLRCNSPYKVYPKKCAHGSSFVVFCCVLALVGFTHSQHG